MTVEVNSIYKVQLREKGLGGIALVETATQPYVKDYDALDGPLDWPKAFDIQNWGIFLARQGQTSIGGAAVAWNTNGVDMLEGKKDMAVLWDIRVHPDHRGKGVGSALFKRARSWAKERRCSQMKIETQNVNVAACKFYVRMGCELGDIRRFGYSEVPEVAHEVQLNWYINL